MKQTKFLVLLAAFFGLTINLSAQEDKQLSQDEITKRRLEYKMSHAKRSMEQTTEISVNDNRYNHREKEIFEKLKSETIPPGFPLYKPEYTNEQYTKLMEEWYKANPTLLKSNTSNQQK